MKNQPYESFINYQLYALTFIHSIFHPCPSRIQSQAKIIEPHKLPPTERDPRPLKHLRRINHNINRAISRTRKNHINSLLRLISRGGIESRTRTTNASHEVTLGSPSRIHLARRIESESVARTGTHLHDLRQVEAETTKTGIGLDHTGEIVAGVREGGVSDYLDVTTWVFEEVGAVGEGEGGDGAGFEATVLDYLGWTALEEC